jgi:chaperonin GroEL (HSP60 family)
MSRNYSKEEPQLIGDDIYPKIHNKKDLRDTINYVFNTLNTTLINSYGPLGGTTIIHNNGAAPIVTKDGLTILKHIRFNTKEEYDIYQLIKAISTKLVDKVGDGSTSSIIISSLMYSHLKETRNKYRTMRDFEKDLKLIQDAISKFVKMRADSFLNEQKSLCTKEKLLVNRNFFFSHSVFKRLALQIRKNQVLFRKRWNCVDRI